MLARLLHKVVDVRDGEIKALMLAFLYHFNLMASYYIIQPLRDAFGIKGGAEDLPALFVASLVVMLGANWVFGSLVKRLPPSRFIPYVYRFFLSNLIVFYLALATSGAKWIAHGFFLWVGIFNLFTISVLWGYIANAFDSAQGKRLYGFIGAGGTAGQLVGSGVTWLLAERIGAVHMLLISMILLEASVQSVRALDRHAGPTEAPPAEESKKERPTSGALDGACAVFASPYLLGICGYIFLYTFTSSFLYFGKSNAIADMVKSESSGASLFASANFAVGAITVLIQMFLTGRIMSKLGVAIALCMVPVWTAMGFGVLALQPLLSTYLAFDISRRTINYAVARPARELLYTVVSREEKYTSKSFIDTFIYRVGDATAAGASALIKWMLLPPLAPDQKPSPELAAHAARVSAMVAIPFAVAWVLCAWWLGRAQQRKAAELAAQPPSLV